MINKYYGVSVLECKILVQPKFYLAIIQIKLSALYSCSHSFSSDHSHCSPRLCQLLPNCFPTSDLAPLLVSFSQHNKNDLSETHI